MGKDYSSTTAGPTPLTKLRSQHNVTTNELERYKLLVETIEDYAIFIMDPTGHIKTWNKGAQKIKGYRPEEIIDHHFSQFYLPHDVATKKPERELDLAKKYGRVEDEDWRVRKDGSKFWANVVITTLYDNTGELVGFAKVTRDLTERKQHEDDLRAANSMLRQQQRDLEALNVSKDEFVSLASHQLRTPATAIKQLLGIMLEGFAGPLTPEHEAIIQRAYDSNERQLSVVNSLLKVAQIDAGKVVLSKSPVNVRKLLSSIVDSYGNTFRSRSQRAELEVAESADEEVLLDIEHFRMALENIIDNASKYTPADGAVVVRAFARGNVLCMAIQDTGVGIAEEDTQKLFVRFSRIHNYLSAGVGGSGLGLYWAKKVVLLHGGVIVVDSVPNKGTTFTVQIPMEKPDA